MHTLDNLVILPFTELEMGHLINLPADSLETMLGIPAGSYNWVEHYPAVMAKQRVLLAKALLRELYGEAGAGSAPIEKSYWLSDLQRPQGII